MSARRGARGPRPWARAANAVLSALLMALFVAHGVGNAFQLVGVGSPLSRALSYALVAVAVAHAALGVCLTAHTLRTQRLRGAAYLGLNARFWAVRVSGLAIAVLVALHALTFWRAPAAPVRLRPFDAPQLVAHLLLVAAVAVHVVANAAPFMVGLGVAAPRSRAADAVVALAVLVALMAAAFVVYYLRWSVV